MSGIEVSLIASVAISAATTALTMLLRPKPKKPKGIEDQVQVSTYGNPIHKVWGAARIAGNVLWLGKLKKKKKEISPKGMGGSSSFYYVYRRSFAVGFSEPVCDILKVWMNTKLVYDKTGESPFTWKYKSPIRFYYGSSTQEPDPIIEARHGIGRSPAFRHIAYIMFEELPLKDFGNQLPNVRALVVTKCVGSKQIDPWITGFLEEGIIADGLAPDRSGQPYAYAVGLGVVTGATPIYRIDAASCKIDDYRQSGYGWGAFGPGDTDEDFYYFNTDHSVYDSDLDRCVSQTLTHARVSLGAFGTDTLLQGQGQCGPVGSQPSDGSWMTDGFYRVNQNYPEIYQVEGADLNHGIINVFIRGVVPVFKFTIRAAGHGGFWDGPERVTDIDGDDQGNIYPLRSDGTSAWVNGFDLSDEVPGAHVIRWIPSDNSLIVANRTTAVKVDAATGLVIKTLTFPHQIGDNNVSSFHGNLYNNTLWLASTVTDTDIEVPPGTFPFFPVFMELNVSSLTITRTEIFTEAGAMYPLPDGGKFFGPTNALYFPDSGSILAQDQSRKVIGCFRIGAGAQCVTLKEVVDELGEKTGQLNIATQTDSSALAGDLVCGFKWARQPIREGLEELATGYFFNAVESDGKIKYSKRDADPLLTVPEADLAAHEQGQQMPAALKEVRQQEIEFPKEIELQYINEHRDYEQDNARAQRTARSVNSTEKHTINLPIVYDPRKARAVIEQISRELWQERTTYEFTLPPLYRQLDPVDNIEIQMDNGIQYLLRLDEINAGANGIIEAKGVQIDPAVYQPLPEGDGIIGGGGGGIVIIASPTRLLLLDTPLLRDQDSGQVIYLAGGPSAQEREWSAALVLRSIDEQNSWTDFSVIENPATLGFAVTALPAPPRNAWTTWDETNSVDVRLEHGTLFNASRAQLLNQENAAVLGDEVIQFRNAVEIDEDLHIWRLSGLARGRRGTEWAIDSHVIGEKFVLLESDTLVRATLPLTDLAVRRDYRGVTAGLALEDSANVPFTWAGNSSKPYSVTMVRGERDGSDNLTITWLRRSRIGTSWQSGVTPALNEATEAYEVDILDSGGDVVRTIETTSQTASYTAAEQTADGLTPGDPVSLVIYQISASVDRGFPKEATV